MHEPSDVRQSILLLLKNERSVTIAEIAERLDVTYEAVRQQIAQMETDGWVVGSYQRTPDSKRRVGRPTKRYGLTTAGDHLFPKNYDALLIEVIALLSQQMGPESITTILATLTEARVRQWEPMLRGKTLEQRIEALKDFYLENDPFTDVEESSGVLRLIERNCPFLNVATELPVLCSVTVSTLARLLGHRVVREERFQAGNRRCVFRILTDQPVDVGFRFEIESAGDGE
jgi:predicted ArsR family transcriptional regulator